MFSKSNFLQRHARWIMLVLLFCMGMAMASPLVKPRWMALVCTGSNAVVLVVADTEGDPVKLIAMVFRRLHAVPPPPFFLT